MWPGLLLGLSGLLILLAVVLWPDDEVWKMECQDCEWGADLSGPRDHAERAAAAMAFMHWEATDHAVTLKEKRR